MSYICSPKGEMLEWLKRRVWKARDRPKRFRSSNLLLSAFSRALIVTIKQSGLLSCTSETMAVPFCGCFLKKCYL